MALEKYREKRRFGRTPEPAGDEKAAGERDSAVEGSPSSSAGDSGAGSGRHGLAYVIQKHAATRLHYDFRLELDGVLLSWAIPKGPSLDPRDRHLAARVEDHPLEYGDFEGIIPQGEYGGGTVVLWDRGTWEPLDNAHEGLARGELKFALHGQKLKGSWVLVRMKPRPGQGEKENWLLIKHQDDAAVNSDGAAILRDETRSVASGRTLEEIAAAGTASVWHGDLPANAQPDARPGEEFSLDPSSTIGARRVAVVPQFVRPELATLVTQAPAGGEWLHEIKFDGYRALARIENGSVDMYSRNDKNWTDKYRVLVDELAKLPVEDAMLDGEVVVQLPDGTTSFQELQNTLGTSGGGPGQLLYYVFDLLYLNGYELLDATIEDRKELLKRLLAVNARSGRIRFSEHLSTGGDTFLAEACRLGLEGVVSKRAGTRYRPGVRGGEWLKSKCSREQEFVIGGFTDPRGGRTGFGALLLGVHEDSRLRYVGKVGTGFSEEVLQQLGERLRRIEIESPPFAQDLVRAPKGSHWVKPELVAEVAFFEWTRSGDIRQPSFKGLREDKSPPEVVREEGTAVMEPPKARQQASHRTSDPPTADPGVARAPESRTGTTLTHPDRVFWPLGGITKRDLFDYYDMVAERMLPYVLHRPLALVRCPDGLQSSPAAGGEEPSRGPVCFFHKHAGRDFPGPFERVAIEESRGQGTYLTIIEPGSLAALAQMGVLEIHTWGSTWPDIERPDVLVFDLDPDPAVEWAALAQSARLMREMLQSLGLESFVKTTGGKGLHVVAPITPVDDWEVVRSWAKSIAQAFVDQAPDAYTANMSKAKRAGKIYVDYLRNARGATSIAPYSTRATEHATVSVPLRWSELSGRVRPDTYTITSLKNRLSRLRRDPWEGYFEVQRAQTLTGAVK